MTQERKNNLVHNIQLGVIGLCFTGIGWLINSTIEIKVLIGKYQTQQEINYQTMQTLQSEYELLDTRQFNHETRISILEQDINRK